MKIDKFVYLLGFSALTLALTAAYFSITGFAALFSGAFISIIVMISGLELAKLVTASFLYRYWNKLTKLYKFYLTLAVVVLVIITSAGIYGYLSSAYSFTANRLVNVNEQIVLIDSRKAALLKINDRIQKNIDDKYNRANILTSLRVSQELRIDSLYKRWMIASAKRTENIIKNIDEEVSHVNRQIDSLNKTMTVNADSILKLDASMVKLMGADIVSEIGPLKYIATLMNKSIDSVAHFFILLLVFIFDPLTVCLVIATNKVLLKEGSKFMGSDKYDWLYKWRKDQGEDTLRVNYMLNEDSIIVDIGLAEERWLQMMSKLYNCVIYVFEKDKDLYDKMIKVFGSNDKFKIYNYELTSDNKDKGVITFLESLGLKKIDLMKLNMCGNEYNLLNTLLDNNVCENILNYQVQFSRSVRNYLAKYNEIEQKFIKRNYFHTYYYSFIWENFKKL